jgi:GNAT superfamily N-acetyltransferase
VVAEEGGRMIVGFAAGHIEEGLVWQGARRVGRITDCFVAAPRRRRGIARRLVGRVMDALYQRGAETVRLAVATEATGTRRFWAAMGFDELDVVLEREICENGDVEDPAP